LGLPVTLLKSIITPKEFNGWVKYLNNLQPDVQETQMAVLMLMVAQGLGSKNAKFSDFIVSGKQNDMKKTKKPATAFDSFAAVGIPYTGPKN